MTDIKQFYDNNGFPGIYSIDQLTQEINNRYLNLIDKSIAQLGPNKKILDVGCGTGLVSNYLALRHSTNDFLAIDFANSVNFAKQFAINNNITNIQFCQIDFLDFDHHDQFDAVICQGVLHHIPNSTAAIKKIKYFSNNLIILGLYHPWGKVVKKYFKIDYQSNILEEDQENNPFEITYTVENVRNLFSEFKLINSYPCAINIVSHIESLLNYRNGGLITYVFKRE
jgi:SAM-dependent methyltransferase